MTDFPNVTIYTLTIAYYDFDGQHARTEAHLFSDAALDDNDLAALDSIIAKIRRRRWAVMESESERLEEQAEAAMEQEFADMMALALTEDLPPDLQEVCEFFI